MTVHADTYNYDSEARYALHVALGSHGINEAQFGASELTNLRIHRLAQPNDKEFKSSPRWPSMRIVRQKCFTLSCGSFNLLNSALHCGRNSVALRTGQWCRNYATYTFGTARNLSCLRYVAQRAVVPVNVVEPD